MKNKPQKFVYKGAKKISGWNCHFDSLTELKYLISIHDDYEYLRERVSIYYHPGTKQPTEYLRECYRRYTPDFLIRHKETGKAYLVEIKPRAFEGDPQLALRKEVAENYIRWKKYDWEYKVVFDDEILLTEDQLEAVNECRQMRSKTALAAWYEQYNRKLDRNAVNAFTNASDTKKIQFIMYGVIQTEIHFVKTG